MRPRLRPLPQWHGEAKVGACSKLVVDLDKIHTIDLLKRGDRGPNREGSEGCHNGRSVMLQRAIRFADFSHQRCKDQLAPAMQDTHTFENRLDVWLQTSPTSDVRIGWLRAHTLVAPSGCSQDYNASTDPAAERLMKLFIAIVVDRRANLWRAGAKTMAAMAPPSRLADCREQKALRKAADHKKREERAVAQDQRAGAQVVEKTTGERLSWLCQLMRRLRKRAVQRAVIFTSSRDEASALHDQLKKTFPCAVLPESGSEQESSPPQIPFIL